MSIDKERLAPPEDVAGTWVPVPAGIEWHHGPYTVSTDPGRLDTAVLTDVLARTYWATDIPEDVVRRSIANSVSFGLYHGSRQIGFARAITDRATFAWVGDVYVDEAYQGHGLALWLMRCLMAHPELQDLRRWMLATSDAHGLYRKVGFVPMAAPDRFMEIADMGVHRRQRAERERHAEQDPGP